jgi:Phage integrase family
VSCHSAGARTPASRPAGHSRSAVAPTGRVGRATLARPSLPPACRCRHSLLSAADASSRALLRRAGLPPIRFHNLRHTFATLQLMAATNPKIVSEVLGHKEIAITLDRYSHALPTMQTEAMARLDAVLGRSPLDRAESSPRESDRSGLTGRSRGDVRSG